jgi:hypothetical protein
LIAGFVAGCAPAATPQATQAPAATVAPEQTEVPAKATEVAAEPGAAVCGEPGKTVTVGLSNGYFGTDWRTQDLNVAQQVFDEAKEAGLIGADSELIIQNAGADTTSRSSSSAT